MNAPTMIGSALPVARRMASIVRGTMIRPNVTVFQGARVVMLTRTGYCTAM